MEGGGGDRVRPRGHVFLVASRTRSREDEDGDSAKETIPVAAAAAFVVPSRASPGRRGWSSSRRGETLVVRVQAGGKSWRRLCATHVSRRPVLAFAASPISREIDDASDFR